MSLVVFLVGALPAAAASTPIPPDNPGADIPYATSGDAACAMAPSGASCEQQQLVALDNARAALNLAPYAVPETFFGMPPEQQLFVLSNLDRVLYGLVPATALDVDLNKAAQQGATAGTDPAQPTALTGAESTGEGGSNWASGFENALGAYYFWMYGDGYGGGNVDCTSPTASGCWVHRDVTVRKYPAFPTDQQLLMGAAASSANQYAEVWEVDQDLNNPPEEMTWQSAVNGGAGSRPTPVVASLTAAGTGAGATITVSGYNLTGGTVMFGTTTATSTCTDTMCTATVPQTPGTVDVTVETQYGQSVPWSADEISSSIGSVRIAGPDRVATSIVVSQRDYPTNASADAVIVSRADGYADALAAIPLAVKINSPILLTGTSGLDHRVAAEISRVLAPGGIIIMLGGTLALSQNVQTELAALGYQVIRLAGSTRFGTAVLIAEQLHDPQRVIEVDGYSYADAASAGPAAAKDGAAVLLTDGKNQHHDTQTYLAAHPDDIRVTVGGPAAAADPGALSSIVGADRFQTAVMVAATYFQNPAVIGLASGYSYSDILSAGTAVALSDEPLLLTKSNALPSPDTTYITDDPSLSTIDVFGGTYAINDSVVSAALQAR